MSSEPIIAYFSMEIGVQSDIPTYSGGLGVLAGDTVRSAADLGIPMVAISLLARKGYFHQTLDFSGWQSEEPNIWVIENYFTEVNQRVSITIETRTVHIRCWKYTVTGNSDQVSVYFLDTDLEENSEQDRRLTDHLYGGDNYYRLCQEIILGIGGILMLRKLGYTDIRRYHMNEGHASLLILELLKEEAYRQGDKFILDKHRDEVRKICIFTTHTPVPAGHDQFAMDLFERLVHESYVYKQCKDTFCFDNRLNLTYLALTHSRYINGVAKKHKEITQQMFGAHQIDSITNGVHTKTWASEPFSLLFDKYIPGWQADYSSLRYALNIPLDDIWNSHQAAKKRLLECVNGATNSTMSMDVMTIGFARRATHYKHSDLVLADINKLKELHNRIGNFQMIFSGKAHPHDMAGKELIQKIFRIKELLAEDIKIAYLPNYSMELGKLLTSGSDIWLNTPQPPLEASGTSGMKAALNGVPSFSILDGWWLEGCIENVTGWAIGERDDALHTFDPKLYAQKLYEKLQTTILPKYYSDRNSFINIMRHTIAINGSFFNTERMLNQYISKAYY
ncbi:MAG: alpha-glucan family phosphorylase [Gammaproteobacteria bacterium]|nr:alpha-glucan family phosphorylase [Gammaproteobacteria bacterium]